MANPSEHVTGGSPGATILRFGPFELNRRSGQLFKAGHRLKLSGQPIELLLLLLERPGDLVTRQQAQDRLWGQDVVVDYDTALNTAVKRIRQALDDDASNPRFIETLPRKGFRFLAPVHFVMEPRVELPAVVTPPSAEAATPELPAPPTPDTPPAPRRLSAPVKYGLAAVALIAAVFGGYRLFRLAALPDAQPIHFTLDLPAGHEVEFGAGRRIAVSPDGATVAVLLRRLSVPQVLVRRFDETEFKVLPYTEHATSIFFSPDGSTLGFFTASELRRISLDGRNLKTILALPGSIWKVALWGRDGFIYLTATTFPGKNSPYTMNVWRVPAEGGSPEPVLSGLTPTTSVHFPQQMLPGDRLLFSSNWGPRDLSVSVWSFRNPGSAQIVSNASGGVYVDSGHLLFARSGNLMAARFDLGDLAIRGKEQVAVPDIAVDHYAGLQAGVSQNGTLVFLRGHRVKPHLPVWVDLNGKETPSRLPAARYRLLDVSKDGKKLLLTRFLPGTRWSILSYHLDNDTWQELSSGEEPNTGAIWSPDGATVALTANVHNERFENIYLKHGNQDLDQPLLPPAELGRFPQSWSKEANAIAFVQGYDTRTLTDIWVVPASGGAPQCFACTELEERLPSFSPEGKWIAYTSTKIGSESNIYVKAWPPSGAPIRVSPDGGRNSLWDPTGRKLYYFKGKEMYEVSFDPRQTRPGQARRLFAGRYRTGEIWNRDMILSPDGKRFLLLKEVDEPPEWKKIHVVKNWFAELQRLTPSTK